MPLPDMPPSAVSLPLMREEFEAAAPSSLQSGKIYTRPRCAPTTTGEIVVCASDPMRYRLSELTEQQDDALKAQFGLGDGVVGAVRTEYSAIGGAPSNRVMVDLKFKF